MPVLGQDDMREFAGETIDRGDHGVAVGHGERAARTEIVLHIDNDQCLAVAAWLTLRADAHFPLAARRDSR